MTSRATSRRESISLQLTGIVYLVVVALLVWLAIAIYDKTFTDHVTVELRAEKAGLQLNVGGDVRMNGAIVGRVSSVKPGSPGARVSLQIDHKDADLIPIDATARILPTTLFGQKFVELASPDDPAGGHLTNGSVIQQDTSTEAVEVSDVLDHLDPLLTAVKPERLAATLGSVATGLDGRGAELGQLIDSSGDYLTSLNELTPGLEKDLKLIDRVSGQYASSAPDLLAIARNAAVTTSTVSDRQADLKSFFTNVTDVSEAGQSLLEANQANLIESAKLARPTLATLDRYSPEIDCVVDGFLAVAAQTTSQISGVDFNGYFTLGAQEPGYGSADAYKPGDLGTGPACRGLPNAPIPYPGVQLKDGYTHPPPNDLLPILLGPDVAGEVLP